VSMSVVHELLSEIEEKETSTSPWMGENSNPRKGLFVFDLPNEILNDFYDLKEYIRIANLRGKMRVLSIASSLMGEGSTTIATYLAFLMTGKISRGVKNNGVFTADFQSAYNREIQKPVEKPDTTSKDPYEILLIDANLHKPNLHNLFNVDVENGLAEILEHHLDWQQFIRPVDDSNLRLLTAGNTEMIPTELLGSEYFRGLVQQWREQFRYIIFDSPPVLSHADALSLATICDGVVLVVRAGQTRWEIAQSAKRKLSAARANVLGVALNRRRFGID
jgi:capsular exopolysaccharide synthesis family protein